MAPTRNAEQGNQAGPVALSVPDAHGLGVAGRTSLYPALGMGAAGIQTVLLTSPDAARLRQCRRQILIVAEAPDERHRAFLSAASRASCPTLVVRWDGAPTADVFQLAAGIDPALVGFTDPRDAVPDGDRRPIASALLVPARADLDRLLFASFPSLHRPAAERDGGSVAASELWLTVIAADTEALARIAPALSRTLRAGGGPSVLYVTPNPAELEVARRQLGLPGRVLDESDPHWLAYLRESRAVLIPMGADGAAAGPSLNAAIWALTAMRAGAPVIADANPLLDPVAGSFISDDWERGLALYVESSSALRSVDAAIGQARAAQLEWVHQALPADGYHPWLSGGVPIPREAKSGKPVLLAFLDLAQDLDVLLPILQAVRQRDQFRLRICVTDWLETEAPRTFSVLAGEGFTLEVLPRKHALDATVPSLDQVDAVLTASETSQVAHRTAHALALRAARAAIPAFTLQHGFENVGLTYRDPEFGANVKFASSHIFVWLAAERLPAWVPPDTFARLIPTGSPKTISTPTADHPLPDLGSWSRKIGLFENLHWQRFSESYRRELFADLDLVAERFPDTLFLIKPHSAGRWLVRNSSFLPERHNIRCIDPTQPEWQIFTAPSLIRHLDAVITTPSTVAVDSARAGRPVAVIGYDLDLALYEPLPILSRFEDWCAFIDELADAETSIFRNETFLRRNFLPYAAQYRIAEIMHTIAMQRRRDSGPKAAADDAQPVTAGG